MFERNYLVIYDIHADKVRKKVTKLLEKYGCRVQYSSFECSLTPSNKNKLKSEINKIKQENDSIRMYRLPLFTEVVGCENVQNNKKGNSIII